MYDENELNTDSEAEGECSVCYAVHDEEIHQATLSIRTWFHRQVTHDFQDQAVYFPGPEHAHTQAAL